MLRNLSKDTRPRSTRAEIWAQTHLFSTLLHCLPRSVINMFLIISSTDHLNVPGFFRLSSLEHTFSRPFLMVGHSLNMLQFVNVPLKMQHKTGIPFPEGPDHLACLACLASHLICQDGFTDFRSMAALSYIYLIELQPHVFLIWASFKSEFIYPLLILLILTNFDGILLDSSLG